MRGEKANVPVPFWEAGSFKSRTFCLNHIHYCKRKSRNTFVSLVLVVTVGLRALAYGDFCFLYRKRFSIFLCQILLMLCQRQSKKAILILEWIKEQLHNLISKSLLLFTFKLRVKDYNIVNSCELITKHWPWALQIKPLIVTQMANMYMRSLRFIHVIL